MNISITNNYNTYINIPFNIGVVHLFVRILEHNGMLVKSYNTRNFIGKDRYQLLVFNGFTWKKMPLNGVDSSLYRVVAVNFNFDKDKKYIVQYQFTTIDGQNIELSNYSPIFVESKNNSKNDTLIQKLNIVQNVQLQYDQASKEYKNMFLHWKHSWDYDSDLIYYQIQIYKLNHSVSSYINHYNQLQFKQFSSYSLFETIRDINKNQQEQQKHYFQQTHFDQNVVYKYRVRAYDEYGQYSNWSDYYYFKKIKSFYGKVLVRRNYFSELFNTVQILPPVKDLRFATSVKQRPMSQLQSTIHIKQPSNLQLFFGLIIQYRQIFYDNVFGTVHVKDDKSKLNMDVIISKRFTLSLFNSVHVFANKNQLVSTIEVQPTLIQKIWVNGVYQSKQLTQKVQVFLSFAPLVQNMIIKKWFYPTDNTLKGFCTIGKRFSKPIQMVVFDQNGQQKNTDNRIKLFDQNGQRIYTYNKNGQFINVYPYVQDGVNNPIDVYDYNGQQLFQFYDEDGELVNCVYTNENIVKNWLSHGKYKIQFTIYDNLTSYVYNYAKQSNIQVLYPTKQSFVNVDINSSGQWTFVVRAVKNNANLHKHDTFETLYINIPPENVQLPFYINGQFMDNYNIVNNSNPTFTFYGVENKDNDSWKYLVQIAKDIDFSNIVNEKYLQYSTSIVTYTPNSDLLLDQGWYYFRVLTIDYNDKQAKQVAISPSMQFKYQHYRLNLYGRLQRVNRSWNLLGFMAMMRGNSTIKQKFTLYKHFESDQLLSKLFLYYFKIESQQLKQQLIIITDDQKNNLIGEVLITQNHSTLTSNIVLQYHYHNFPKTETYIDQNGQQHTVILLDVPKQHYIYGKCMVYYGSTQKLPDQSQFTIHFGKIKVSKRHFSTYEEQPKHKILIMNRGYSEQQKMQCRIWNQYELPCSMTPLKQMVAISNRVNMIAWLFGKMQLRYPQPPTVIVTSNIPQKIWQTNYNAVFNFTLQQQSVLPLMWYVYVIDDKPNTIPTLEDDISYGQVICDLRQVVPNKLTGIRYIHVRSVNIKNVCSSVTTTYCVYYNNKIDKPVPLSVNGESVVGDQMPVIQYNKALLFYWKQVIDAIDVIDKITYDLQIATDVNFTDIAFQQKNISGNVFTLLPRTISPNKYFWRVRAFDQNQYSSWSITAIIYINKAPQPPTRLSVKNYS